MQEFKVEKKDDNKKLIQCITSKYKNLSQNTLYKAMRNKDIKINGKRISEDILLKCGDVVEIYISDDLICGKKEIKKSLIIYEDEYMLVYNKPKELEVQGNSKEPGLEELLKSNLKIKYLEACHRIDRNTTGLVIFAKDEKSRVELVKMINDKTISKFYKAYVYGILKQKRATLKAYLFKDSKNSNVIISNQKNKGYVEIITKYKVLSENKESNTSLLEIELLTGRTHQIRAHLAYIGYPIIGDGKYGINKINKAFKKKYQMLEAYKLVFSDNIKGRFSYLSNKVIEI